MAKRMLIDSTHPEEIRVVVLDGNRLDEFDFETSTKKQVKGNIYLAKVTRVEPSLQAAFVDYGGNRHGFLAFSEIHPDYYRIPVSDRDHEREQRHPPSRHRDSEPASDQLPHDDTAEAAFSGTDAGHEPLEHGDDTGEHGVRHDESEHDDSLRGAAAPLEMPHDDAHSGDLYFGEADHDPSAEFHDENEPGAGPETAETRTAEAHIDTPTLRDTAPSTENGDVTSEWPPSAEPELSLGDEPAQTAGEATQEADRPAAEFAPVPSHDEAPASAESIEIIGGDEMEEASRQRARRHRHYKVQEVVKRRQIMLVQVTKEERGNKGAALTTYLSLAGRYCVLMPNTDRSGGVSRKITNTADRRRLKELVEDLEVPEGMGVIVRTAGSERSKAEIKRDFEYLFRLWDEIREHTLKSTAPALIYEEGNLIKRSIRDLYTRDLEEVIVEGEDGYKAARAFMKMLMPSHAKRIHHYRDPTTPLFQRYQVETQIDAIHSPVVQLRSGGYIVINPTEALVSIDVNSGRATKERNIEETALKTNCEAAEEIARQLRLRDLAGLIVIDFIDMEEHRNQATVERRLKEAMKHDRARIQVGRISAFGLMEMSRQRLRPSLVEASTQPCPHCGGTGHIRSVESTALHVLRAIEEEGMRRRSAEISVAVPSNVALYILNQKRPVLGEIERRYHFRVTIVSDDTLIPPNLRLERLRSLTPVELAALPPPVAAAPDFVDEEDEDLERDEDEAEDRTEDRAEPAVRVADEHRVETRDEQSPERNEDGQGRRRRRRRRRGGDKPRDMQSSPSSGEGAEESGFAAEHDMDVDRSATDESPDRHPSEDIFTPEEASGDALPDASQAGEALNGEAADSAARKRRRRGRRGGRRRRRGANGELHAQDELPQNGLPDEDGLPGDDGPSDESYDDAAMEQAGIPEYEAVFEDRAEAFADRSNEPQAQAEASKNEDRVSDVHAGDLPAHEPPPPAYAAPAYAAPPPAEQAPSPAPQNERQPGGSVQAGGSVNVPPPVTLIERPTNPRRGWWHRLTQS